MLVTINNKAERDVRDKVGKVGIIHSIHHGAIYDYYVLFEDDALLKFRQDELNIIH